LASISLYRKHRPQNFAEVVGQNHIKETLKNAILANRISHAYLFTGPRGIGKTTIARIFAKAVNCQKTKNAEPDNKCSNCLEITQGKSLDLIEIDGASNRGIDEIRELTEKIKFTPHNSKFKIFIIDEVHMLTKEAFNALLKTLEEPPAHAIFILATTEVHKIPATVLSRCQRFNFTNITIEQIANHLKELTKKEKITAEPEALYMIASYAGGALRDAVSLLDQIASFGNKKVTTRLVGDMLGVANIETANRLIEFIIKNKTKEALTLIDKTVQEGIDINIFVENLIESLRNILLIKTENQDQVKFFNEKDKSILNDLAKEISPKQLIKIIEQLNQAKQKIKYSTPPQLPIELIIAENQIQENIYSDKNDDTEIQQTNRQVLNIKKTKNSNFREKNIITKENARIKKIGIKEPEKKQLDEAVNQGKLFTQIQQGWSRIIGSIKENNHVLALCLETAGPENIEDGHLMIGFDFPLHRDKIQAIDNKMLIENIIEKQTGNFIPIRCFIRSKRDKVDNQTIDKTVNFFGGELI